jgi:hypothetical protein
MSYSFPVVKINCALDALPNFRCRLPGQDANFSSLLAAHTSASTAASATVPGEVALSDAARRVPPHLRGTIHFESSMQQIDASYRDAAAGRASERPLVEMTLPSVLDASLAPPGKHVALLFCQYAPRSLDWSRPGTVHCTWNSVFSECIALLFAL